jgi:anti-sigma factor RsiW
VTCKDIVSVIPDHLEGELSGLSRAMFERHIVTCPNCACYLAQYRATIVIVRRAFGEPADTSSTRFVPEELIEAILLAGRL